MKVGDKIRFFRKKQKLTQKELARKAGLAEITIRQYESGLYEPKFDTAKKIAVALEISVYDLMEWDNVELTKEVEFIEQAAQIGGSTYEMNLAFARLNEDGKQKALAYIEDLLQIDAYCLDEGQEDK